MVQVAFKATKLMKGTAISSRPTTLQQNTAGIEESKVCNGLVKIQSLTGLKCFGHMPFKELFWDECIEHLQKKKENRKKNIVQVNDASATSC